MCPSGKYGELVRATQVADCTSCPRGFYGVAEGARNATAACAPCPTGTSSSIQGAAAVSFCQPCPVGRVAQSSGLEACADCPAGHYAPNGTVCVACDANRILSEARDACQGLCEAGSSPFVPDHLSCTPCPTGEFAPEAASTDCHPCPLGTFSGTRGATRCEECPVGKFGEERGLAQCTSCPTDRTTLQLGMTSYIDCVCVQGMYADVLVYERDTLTCLQCADRGMVCAEGRMPTPEAGFWHDPRGEFDVMFPCEPPEACSGRDLYGPDVHAPCGLAAYENGSTAAVHRVCGTPDPLILPAEAGCETGFRGIRCSMCDSGFYRLNGFCEVCPETRWIMLVVVGVALVVVAAAAAFVVRSGISLAPLTIGMDYFQTLSRISTVRADWTPMSQDMLSLTRVFELDVEMTAPECFVETSFTQTWTAVMAMPFVLTALLVATHVLLFLASSIRTDQIRVPVNRASPETGQRAPQEHASARGWPRVVDSTGPSRRNGSGAGSGPAAEVIPSASYMRRLSKWETAGLAARLHARRLGAELLLLLQVLYVQLSVKALTAIDCTSLPNGQQALDASPDIICWQGEHAALVGRASVAIAGYVLGIPLLFAVVLGRLMRLRQRLRARHAAIASAAGQPKLSHRLPGSLQIFAVQYFQQSSLERRVESIEQVASSLFKRFGAEHTQWILVIMLRKVLLAAATVLSSSRPGVQLALFAGVLFCAMLAQIRKSPYARLSPRAPDAVHMRGQGKISWIKRARNMRGRKTLVAARRHSVGRSIQSTLREAARDPNVMEQTSIIASLAVVLAAMLYYAGSTAAADGYPLDPRAMILLDFTLIAIVASVSLYMLALLVFPLLTVCIHRARGRRAKQRIPAAKAATAGSRGGRRPGSSAAGGPSQGDLAFAISNPLFMRMQPQISRAGARPGRAASDAGQTIKEAQSPPPAVTCVAVPASAQAGNATHVGRRSGFGSLRPEGATHVRHAVVERSHTPLQHRRSLVPIPRTGGDSTPSLARAGSVAAPPFAAFGHARIPGAVPGRRSSGGGGISWNSEGRGQVSATSPLARRSSIASPPLATMRRAHIASGVPGRTSSARGGRVTGPARLGPSRWSAASSSTRSEK